MVPKVAEGLSALPGIRGTGVIQAASRQQGVGQGAQPKAQEQFDRLELSAEAQQVIAALKATDAKVRAHEAAHVAAGAGLVRGGASYSYTRGPDGKQYATGGEVSIDTSEVPGDPEATLAKAQQIQAAALAPADPSAQDRAVAAAAAAMAAKAQGELIRQGPEGQGRGDSRGADDARGLLLDVIA